MKAITRFALYHLTGNLIRPLYTFWSLVNLLTAAQIHWNEGRSLGFSAQHSVKMEYLKVAKLHFFLVFFTKKDINNINNNNNNNNNNTIIIIIIINNNKWNLIDVTQVITDFSQTFDCHLADI